MGRSDNTAVLQLSAMEFYLQLIQEILAFSICNCDLRFGFGPGTSRRAKSSFGLAKIADARFPAPWARVECMMQPALGSGVGAAGCRAFLSATSRSQAAGGAAQPRPQDHPSPDSPFCVSHCGHRGQAGALCQTAVMHTYCSFACAVRMNGPGSPGACHSAPKRGCSTDHSAQVAVRCTQKHEKKGLRPGFTARPAALIA